MFVHIGRTCQLGTGLFACTQPGNFCTGKHTRHWLFLYGADWWTAGKIIVPFRRILGFLCDTEGRTSDSRVKAALKCKLSPIQHSSLILDSTRSFSGVGCSGFNGCIHVGKHCSMGERVVSQTINQDRKQLVSQFI